jgi:hypothetical protein
MAKYAKQTSVGSEKSRAEIERTFIRYGATGFMYGWQGSSAIIAFQANGRQIKFLLPLPDRSSKEFTHTPGRGLRRNEEAARQAYEQAIRQRWRAVALVIKAKLEAVEAGISLFEDEFLAYTVLPDGLTVGQSIHPQIERAYTSGQVPELLPGKGEDRRAE